MLCGRLVPWRYSHSLTTANTDKTCYVEDLLHGVTAIHLPQLIQTKHAMWKTCSMALQPFTYHSIYRQNMLCGRPVPWHYSHSLTTANTNKTCYVEDLFHGVTAIHLPQLIQTKHAMWKTCSMALQPFTYHS